ncbi:uncharacterized protein BXZ73DRAFT_76938 [Epithele typhae]|uniref:uncharacterized protein n=1 Tax=Epithele typhae TaxID=378194 RepID=UPI002007DC15|nr:uncharacterized protein BXZ73DRAFT_76938 [Epithele typhae]KAH9934447.1 hypothetical protein BXZ73DRAFT_76938 [Epithele typhae]
MKLSIVIALALVNAAAASVIPRVPAGTSEDIGGGPGQSWRRVEEDIVGGVLIVRFLHDRTVCRAKAARVPASVLSGSPTGPYTVQVMSPRRSSRSGTAALRDDGTVPPSSPRTRPFPSTPAPRSPDRSCIPDNLAASECPTPLPEDAEGSYEDAGCDAACCDSGREYRFGAAAAKQDRHPQYPGPERRLGGSDDAPCNISRSLRARARLRLSQSSPTSPAKSVSAPSAIPTPAATPSPFLPLLAAPTDALAGSLGTIAVGSSDVVVEALTEPDAADDCEERRQSVKLLALTVMFTAAFSPVASVKVARRGVPAGSGIVNRHDLPISEGLLKTEGPGLAALGRRRTSSEKGGFPPVTLK